MKNILTTATVGAVVGLCWAFAIAAKLSNSLLYGAISGVVIGFVLLLFASAASSRGAVTKQEAGFVGGSILGFLLIIGVVSALIAFIVRLIFF